MPGFTPGRRWQPAYYPFHKEPFSDRLIALVERTVPVKGCYLAAVCAEIVCCRKLHLSVQWNARKVCVTVHAVDPVRLIVTLTRHDLASGIKFINAVRK